MRRSEDEDPVSILPSREEEEEEGGGEALVPVRGEVRALVQGARVDGKLQLRGTRWEREGGGGAREKRGEGHALGEREGEKGGEGHALGEGAEDRDDRKRERENHPLYSALYSLWKDQRKLMMKDC